MLVHKKTMGVLGWFWSGRYKKGLDGTAVPLMVEYTFANTGLPPEEWWYVPKGSALGRKLLRFYPFCDPVVGDDGTLTDIRIREQEEEAPADVEPEHGVPGGPTVRWGENEQGSVVRNGRKAVPNGADFARTKSRQRRRKKGLLPL